MHRKLHIEVSFIIHLATLRVLIVFYIDIHIRNLAFILPPINNILEETFIAMFKRLEVGVIRRADGRPLKQGMPEHLMQIASYRRSTLKALNTIKIVNFG
jgi:hypothetical protein